MGHVAWNVEVHSKQRVMIICIVFWLFGGHHFSSTSILIKGFFLITFCENTKLGRSVRDWILSLGHLDPESVTSW